MDYNLIYRSNPYTIPELAKAWDEGVLETLKAIEVTLNGTFSCSTIDSTIENCEQYLGLIDYDEIELRLKKRDDWPSPIRSPFHRSDCYRRDEHIAPDQCAAD